VHGDEHGHDVAGPAVRGELVEVQLVDQEAGDDHRERRGQEECVEDAAGA